MCVCVCVCVCIIIYIYVCVCIYIYINIIYIQIYQVRDCRNVWVIIFFRLSGQFLPHNFPVEGIKHLCHLGFLCHKERSHAQRGGFPNFQGQAVFNSEASDSPNPAATVIFSNKRLSFLHALAKVLEGCLAVVNRYGL